MFPKSYGQVIEAVGETDDELSLSEFNLGGIALLSKIGHLGFDMRERNRLNRLSQRHIRLYDCLAVGHIESVTQQKVGVQHYL
jgi:hypothetical protein